MSFSKRAPLPPYPNDNFILARRICVPRDQPQPGSFLNKREEPGNEVAPKVAILKRYKHAPFPPLSQLQLNLPPRIWEARDQPQPGSLPDDRRRDPGNEVDKKRVKKADHRAKPDVKKRRKVVRGQKKKREDKNQETEGNTYEAGAF